MANEDETQGKTDEGAAGAKGATPTEAIASLGIADTLKTSFAEYIEDHHVVPPEGGGQLNLDWDFIRNHGGPLMAHMFSSLTRQLLPEHLSFSVPAPKQARAAAEAQVAAGEAQDAADDAQAVANDAKAAEVKAPGVSINFDLGDFLGKLFRPPQGGPKER